MGEETIIEIPFDPKKDKIIAMLRPNLTAQNITDLLDILNSADPDSVLLVPSEFVSEVKVFRKEGEK